MGNKAQFKSFGVPQGRRNLLPRLLQYLDVQPLDLLLQRRKRNAELLGSVGLVPVAAIQYLPQLPRTEALRSNGFRTLLQAPSPTPEQARTARVFHLKILAPAAWVVNLSSRTRQQVRAPGVFDPNRHAVK